MTARDSRTLGSRVPGGGRISIENSRLTRWALSGLGVILLLVFWQSVATLLGLDPQYFPSPIDVMDALQRTWPTLTDALPHTLAAAVVGYLIALVLSIFTAMVLVANERLLNALMPFIIGVNTVPRIALTPLVIYWVGFISLSATFLANYVMAVWVAFFPMLIAALDGFKNIDEATENMLAMYGATTWQEFKFVRLRKGLPFIFDGMKSGFILAMIGTVVGEFVSGTFGIGSMASSVIGQIAIGRAIAIVLVLGFISSGVVFLIYQIESQLIFWQESSIMGEE